MPSRYSFRTLPPGIKRIPLEGLIIIMNDGLVIDLPFFTAGEYLNQTLVNIFLDAPTQERTVFPRKRLVRGSGVCRILFENDRGAGSALVRYGTGIRTVSAVSDRKDLFSAHGIKYAHEESKENQGQKNRL